MWGIIRGDGEGATNTVMGEQVRWDVRNQVNRICQERYDQFCQILKIWIKVNIGLSNVVAISYLWRRAGDCGVR